MDWKIKVIWLLTVGVAFLVGFLVSVGFAENLFFMLLIAAIAFVAGMLVYRNNAKKFRKLEEMAREKGKRIEDLIS